MNREEGIGAIVFTGEKLAQLEFLQLMDQSSILIRHLLFGMSALCGILFFQRKLLQRIKIFRRAFQLAKGINERPQPRNFLDVRLRALAVRPEICRRHARFQRG